LTIDFLKLVIKELTVIFLIYKKNIWCSKKLKS